MSYYNLNDFTLVHLSDKGPSFSEETLKYTTTEKIYVSIREASRQPAQDLFVPSVETLVYLFS